MPFNIGKIDIAEDFISSFKDIFGLATPGALAYKGGNATKLFKKEFGGSSRLESENWVGNATKTRRVRYGFTVMTGDSVKSGFTTALVNLWPEDLDDATFYLQIAPTSIKQKENFSTNISATRRGIIVESEGVVFKDIIIQGTTGVFPGDRGNSNAPRADLNPLNWTSAPSPPAGVDERGRSKADGVKTISGYEEFLRLRQFFLRYAKTKLNRDGDLFLIWINEKDGESLIVEPMDFTMDRDARRPMEYQYTITLRAIGNLNALFGSAEDPEYGIFGAIQNISANASAAIQQARQAMNQGFRTLQRISQAIDQTFINPLRQANLALQDFNDGLSSTLALPSILYRNATNEILGIAESAKGIALTVEEAGTFGVKDITNDTERQAAAATDSRKQTIRDQINNDNRVPIPRRFLETIKSEAVSLRDNLNDSVGLGDTFYDAIKKRTPTQSAGPLKEVTEDEYILISEIFNTENVLNQTMATNEIFQTGADEVTNNTNNIYNAEGFDLKTPQTVREVTIENNDTLERIAARELGDPLRWPELMILNRLKPPYISAEGGTNIKKYGDIILVGNR